MQKVDVVQVTYIWIDGAKPTKMLRSKMRVIPNPGSNVKLSDFPQWGFDGSSTYQAEGGDSDLILQPACFIHDPISERNNFLLLCEVLNQDGSPHATNTRAKLCQALSGGLAESYDPWIGFEQEFTLFNGRNPLGWPDGGYPAPQGPFYCGVGADEAFGRKLIEHHTQACIDAGLMIFGTNAEVMPGQWEFQVGYRNVPGEDAGPLTVSDQLWLARWLLYRIGEDYKISVTLHPKPVPGDWNGAGKHTNFSTKQMRDPATGRATIDDAIARLSKCHDKHIKVYGAALSHRLTGRHETAHISKFSSGVSDRSCSIRVPASVSTQGCGYIEDRRPGANADPYEVSTILLQTICEKATAKV